MRDTVTVCVEFITDCPAIIGVDGVVYGPFVAGAISFIPRQNAMLLEKKGVVRMTKEGAE